METDDLFNQMMGMAGEHHRDLCTGKKVLAHGQAWIILHQVTPKLFLAVLAGSKPPVDIKLIRAEQKDFI